MLGRLQADVPTGLRTAGALYLRQTTENSPLAVREALACGLAGVRIDVGGIRAIRAHFEGLPGCAIFGNADPLPMLLAARLPSTTVAPPATLPPFAPQSRRVALCSPIALEIGELCAEILHGHLELARDGVAKPTVPDGKDKRAA